MEKLKKAREDLKRAQDEHRTITDYLPGLIARINYLSGYIKALEEAETDVRETTDGAPRKT